MKRKIRENLQILKMIFNRIKIEENICYKALYFQRCYLICEYLMLNALNDRKIEIEKSPFYHKQILEKFFGQFSEMEETKILRDVMDELRRFRHIFSNNKQLLKFDEEKINYLQRMLFQHKEQILGLFDDGGVE